MLTVYKLKPMTIHKEYCRKINFGYNHLDIFLSKYFNHLMVNEVIPTIQTFAVMILLTIMLFILVLIVPKLNYSIAFIMLLLWRGYYVNTSEASISYIIRRLKKVSDDCCYHYHSLYIRGKYEDVKHNRYVMVCGTIQQKPLEIVVDEDYYKDIYVRSRFIIFSIDNKVLFGHPYKYWSDNVEDVRWEILDKDISEYYENVFMMFLNQLRSLLKNRKD